MARTKARWHGKILRNLFRDGGSVVMLGRLEHDPDRITEFRVNRSNVGAFTLAVVKASELDPSDIEGLIDALGKLLPGAEPPNGRHAVTEEF